MVCLPNNNFWPWCQLLHEASQQRLAFKSSLVQSGALLLWVSLPWLFSLASYINIRVTFKRIFNRDTLLLKPHFCNLRLLCHYTISVWLIFSAVRIWLTDLFILCFTEQSSVFTFGSVSQKNALGLSMLSAW